MEKQFEEQSTSEIIRKYIRLFSQWAWLVLILTVLAGLAIFFISTRQPPMYQTSATVMINVSASSQDIGTTLYASQTLQASYADIMTSRAVLDEVARRLGLEEPNVTVKPVTSSVLLTVTATDSNPERAALIANTVVSVFNEQNRSGQTDQYATSKQIIQSQMDTLNQEVETQSADLALLDQKIQDKNSLIQTTMDNLVTLDQDIRDKNNLIINLQTPANVPLTQEELNQIAKLIQATEAAIQAEEVQKTQLADVIVQTQTELEPLVSQKGTLEVKLENSQHSFQIQRESLDSIILAETQVTSGVILKDPAIASDRPYQPQPLRNALIIAVLTFLLCLGAIFLIDYLDDTFKTPEDIKRYLDLPVVGMIGEMEQSQNDSGLVYVGENPRSPIAEAYRLLRSNLEFASVDQPLNTLLVTSVGPEEGKTTVAVNLAVIIAQGGRRVMLVDTDLRRPTVHRQLNIQNRVGLSDLFLTDPGDVSKVCAWGDTKILAVPSGPLPPNPTDLLGSDKFKQILNKFTESADIVILDTAPSIVSDPIILSSKVDGVLLVIKPGSTKIGAAQATLEQFQRSGARIVGVVLNPLSRNRGRYSSKYEYYSKYQSSSKTESYYSYEGKANKKKSFLGNKVT